ncbi:MAG TPA: C-GCAxxG-C-C family protein [Atribacteraceae bacterium]|nr:C-GCAxxG-C-C family protein [Atribacteraceae bacterium]
MPDAAYYHDQGFNCCEAVLSGMCDYLGIQADIVPRIATGFGGGLGHTGNICGAVTGAVMALGLKYGRNRSEEKEIRNSLCHLVEQFLDRVKQKIGGIQCFELIGVRLNTEEGMAVYREQHLRRRCHDIIEQVEAIAREFINNPNLPFMAGPTFHRKIQPDCPIISGVRCPGRLED